MSSRRGNDYAGKISITMEGYKCQAWHKQSPNKHKIGIFDYEFPDYNIYTANNSCRNPTNWYNGPWCFTAEPGIKWQRCLIPICNVSDELNKIYTTYQQHMHSFIKTITFYAADMIAIIFPPIILILGTVTNILSIKLFSRPSLNKPSTGCTSFIMRVLAVTDTLALHLGAWSTLVYGVTGSYILSGSDINCKLYVYFTEVIRSYAGWVLCVITLERIIALAIPYKVKIICTKKHVAILLVLVLLSICFIYISVFFSIASSVDIFFDKSETTFEVKYVCSFLYSGKAYQLLSFLTQSLLPFSLLLTGDINILVLLYLAHKENENKCPEQLIKLNLYF